MHKKEEPTLGNGNVLESPQQDTRFSGEILRFTGGDMDLRTLVETVKNKGITFKIEGERIKVESQTEPDHETKSILDTLRDRKEELLRVLTSPACAVCGATMTRTKDIYGKPWWACWACAKST